MNLNKLIQQKPAEIAVPAKAASQLLAANDAPTTPINTKKAGSLKQIKMYKRREVDLSKDQDDMDVSIIKEAPATAQPQNDDFKTPMTQPRANKNLKVMKIVEVFGKKKGEMDDSKISINKHEISQSFSDNRKREPDHFLTKPEVERTMTLAVMAEDKKEASPMFEKADIKRVETNAALTKFQNFAQQNWQTPATKPRKLQPDRRVEDQVQHSESSYPSAPGYEPRVQE